MTGPPPTDHHSPITAAASFHRPSLGWVHFGRQRLSEGGEREATKPAVIKRRAIGATGRCV